MTTHKEALHIALDALENPNDIDEYNRSKYDLAITAIKEALAQPEQEPVACVGPWHNGRLTLIPRYSQQTFERDQPLYTTPPQRTWVGLTDEDKQIAFDDTQEGGGFWEFADAIEAKLKEKNT